MTEKTRIPTPHRSKIEWTDWSGGCLNFVERGYEHGDCELGEGCRNCWARLLAQRFKATYSPTTSWSQDKLDALGAWARKRTVTKHRKDRCFVCDTGDLFHPAVPVAFVVKALRLFEEVREVTWQLLTKRPRRAAELIDHYLTGYNPHIWLGTSCENQETYDKRWPELAHLQNVHRWVSLEPLLGEIDLSGNRKGAQPWPLPEWVVVGGESGSAARSMSPHWVTGIRQTCLKFGMPFFFKQWGKWAPSDGFDWTTVREFPTNG